MQPNKIDVRTYAHPATRQAVCIIRVTHKDEQFVQRIVMELHDTDNATVFSGLSLASWIDDEGDTGEWYRLADGYARGLQVWRREGEIPCHDSCPFPWVYDAVLTICDV